MIELSREGSVHTLTMNDGENRWNTSFVRAFSRALHQVESDPGSAALVTRSVNEKFFSNGLDLDWVRAPQDHPDGGDAGVFGAEFMALMGRIITFPMPTVCAINGHAFGAGFMLALCHDVRIMRADRGFICANEMQLGLRIPTAELALFRHKIPMNAFFETVQLARRWTAPDALSAGIIQQTASIDELFGQAARRAEQLAPLGANRTLYGEQKARIFGEHAVINAVHGPAYMLMHADRFH